MWGRFVFSHMVLEGLSTIRLVQIAAVLSGRGLYG